MSPYIRISMYIYIHMYTRINPYVHTIRVSGRLRAGRRLQLAAARPARTRPLTCCARPPSHARPPPPTIVVVTTRCPAPAALGVAHLCLGPAEAGARDIVTGNGEDIQVGPPRFPCMLPSWSGSAHAAFGPAPRLLGSYFLYVSYYEVESVTVW